MLESSWSLWYNPGAMVGRHIASRFGTVTRNSYGFLDCLWKQRPQESTENTSSSRDTVLSLLTLSELSLEGSPLREVRACLLSAGSNKRGTAAGGQSCGELAAHCES